MRKKLDVSEKELAAHVEVLMKLDDEKLIQLVEKAMTNEHYVFTKESDDMRSLMLHFFCYKEALPHHAKISLSKHYVINCNL